MLNVKFVTEGALSPTVEKPGEDLGYTVYALEDTTVEAGTVTKVRTGIVVDFQVGVPIQIPSRIAGIAPRYGVQRIPYGFVVKAHPALTAKNVIITNDVIDGSDRDELVISAVNVEQPVSLDSGTFSPKAFIKANDPIAQIIPLPIMTKAEVKVVDKLSSSALDASEFDVPQAK